MRRPRVWIASIVLLLGIGIAGPSEAQQQDDDPVNPHLEKARKLVDAFKDRQALKALRKAVKWKGNTKPVRAEIHLYRGIAYFNLFQRKRARKAFEQALTIMPTVDLPPSVSPKIQALFEKVRESLPPPPKPEPKPPAEPKQPKKDVEPDYTDDPQPMEQPAPVPSRSSINWPAWVVLGMSLAAGGAGVGLGLSASSSNDQASDRTQPWVVAETHYLNAADRALGANILFGVAGAAAITAVVLFWTGRNKPKQRASAVSFAPGAMTIGGQW